MPLSIRLAAMLTLMAIATPSLAADNGWSEVGQALGKEGILLPGNVYKVSLPRTDLRVTLDGVTLKAGFALGSWLAFQPAGEQAMVMGDLVLTQDEIDPVMRKLEEGGIRITALHNHLLRAEPATMYMHVMGHGSAVKVARALHAALALSKTPFTAPSGAAEPGQIDLDIASMDKIIGAKGNANAGVLQYSIPRKEEIKETVMSVPVLVPPALGTAIAINFQPTGSGKAAITGDFVLTSAEVNPVIELLHQSGIEVTAIHNHMLDDQPRLFFLHFWANDEAQKLAKGLRDALDSVNVAKS
jgi:hypothetical protein